MTVTDWSGRERGAIPGSRSEPLSTMPTKPTGVWPVVIDVVLALVGIAVGLRLAGNETSAVPASSEGSTAGRRGGFGTMIENVLLVLGGTRFVGRAVVETALACGWDVTALNRGLTRELPSIVQQLNCRPHGPGSACRLRWTGPTRGTSWSIPGPRRRQSFGCPLRRCKVALIASATSPARLFTNGARTSTSHHQSSAAIRGIGRRLPGGETRCRTRDR